MPAASVLIHRPRWLRGSAFQRHNGIPNQERSDNKRHEWMGVLVRQCVKENAPQSAEVGWFDFAAIDHDYGSYPG